MAAAGFRWLVCIRGFARGCQPDGDGADPLTDLPQPGARRSRSRIVVGGLAACLLYVTVAVFTARIGLLPIRPIFDGVGPPEPYRWIDPPPDLREGNVQPLAGQAEIPLTPTGSAPLSVNTEDGQTAVTLPVDSIAPKPGESAIRIAIAPLDPADLPKAPEGLEIEGNGYRIEVTYVPSGSPTVLTRPATVILRYPFQSTTMLRLADGSWRELETHLAAAALQLFADSDQLGTFVAAGKPVVPPEERRTFAWNYIAAGVALVVATALILLARRRARPAARSKRRD
jgi:hypothetical protein